MAEVEVESRGYFWWADEPVPKSQWAPNSAVTGALRIDRKGLITLDLDGYLPNPNGPFGAAIPGDSPEKRCIAGFLRDFKHVLLGELRAHGGRASTDGISYSGYRADHCLVGREMVPGSFEDLKVQTLSVDFTEYREWMRRGPIVVKRTKSRIHAKHVTDGPRVFEITSGTLSIIYDVSAPNPYARGHSSVSIKELVELVLSFDDGSSIENACSQFKLLEELMILLTDSDLGFEWPKLSFGKKKGSPFTYYFWRTRATASAPDWHKGWVEFLDVEESLGQVFQTLREKREHFGPGFYMYLGLRRGMRLFVEHRFVNMVWGLESFHRTKFPQDEVSPSLAEKAERIIRQVQGGNDRRWLRGVLKNALEPRLTDRLRVLFKSLPLEFNEERLQTFCDECARLRNDMSHFGGRRERGRKYQDFLQKVMWMSEALACLYHVLLLQEIGIEPERLRKKVYEGYHSFKYKRAFVEVGLLDKEELRTVMPNIPSAIDSQISPTVLNVPIAK